jgi:hypothetical protein
MNIQEKYDYWLEVAQRDLNAANIMFKSSEWFYVAFMRQ